MPIPPDVQSQTDLGFLFVPTQRDETAWVEAGKGHGLLAVDPSLLNVETACQFPIYVYNNATSRFVLLKAQELPITSAQLRQVQSGHRRPVFVPSDYAGVLTSYAAQNLRKVVCNTNISPSTRSRQMYAISKAILVGAFTAETDTPQMEESTRCVSEALIDLLDTGSQALRHLVLAEAHDPSIYSHSLNVCVLGTALTHFLHPDWSKERLREHAQGFLLHDVGKLDITPEIWTKPDKLTPAERKLVRKHPIYGFKRVEKFEDFSEEGRKIVLEHHELCDGSGYPSGLVREDVSEAARVCAIIEPFDDLTSERPYHKQRSVFDALRLLQGDAGTKFDLELFQAFILLFRQISSSTAY